MASLSRRFIAMLTAVAATSLPSRGSFGVVSPTGSHKERIRIAWIASVEGRGLKDCLLITSSAKR